MRSLIACLLLAAATLATGAGAVEPDESPTAAPNDDVAVITDLREQFSGQYNSPPDGLRAGAEEFAQAVGDATRRGDYRQPPTYQQPSASGWGGQAPPSDSRRPGWGQQPTPSWGPNQQAVQDRRVRQAQPQYNGEAYGAPGILEPVARNGGRRAQANPYAVRHGTPSRSKRLLETAFGLERIAHDLEMDDLFNEAETVRSAATELRTHAKRPNDRDAAALDAPRDRKRDPRHTDGVQTIWGGPTETLRAPQRLEARPRRGRAIEATGPRTDQESANGPVRDKQQGLIDFLREEGYRLDPDCVPGEFCDYLQSHYGKVIAAETAGR